MKSTEMNVNNAGIKIAEMESADDITAFIEGDERKTVIDAAMKRKKELTPKEGQSDRMTRDSNGFKKDIQREKVTGEDVIKKLRDKGYKI